MSKRYKPGKAVASISTKPPEDYAPVTVWEIIEIATLAAPDKTYLDNNPVELFVRPVIGDPFMSVMRT